MALSYVGGAAASASSVALPSFVAGDIAIVFAYRDGSTTPPSLASGWTPINTSGAGTGGNSNSARMAVRVLASGETTTGTWTNATEIQVIVLRGQHATEPIGGYTTGGANSNSISYTGFTLSPASGSPQGTSWVVGMAGHRTATNVNAQSVTGMTTRSGSIGSLGVHTDDVATTFATSTYTSTVNASAVWCSHAIEIHAAPSNTSTSVAQISLAAGNTPATRTQHIVHVSARVTVASDAVLNVALYEGATLRSTLVTSTLTATLASYTLPVPDADAAAIGSYSNLELRVWGTSAAGNASVFEVSELSMEIPASSTSSAGAVTLPITFGAVTSGNSSGSGTKQTSVARLSLGSGFTPGIREDHYLHVRARKTSGAHTGTIRAFIYEGATPRTAQLESSALTTSLANYSLDIADADAATITDYSNLEVRIWGYSSTGTATVFEVAQVSLEIPTSSTTGDVEGAVHFSAITGVVVNTLLAIFPGAAVYPRNLANFAATSTVVIAGVKSSRGIVAMPITFGAVTAGSTLSDVREGAVVFSAVGTIAVDSDVDHEGAVVFAGVSTVSVFTGTNVITAQVEFAAVTDIDVDGDVPSPPAPPDFVSFFDDSPGTLIAIAFSSQPFDIVQTYSGVTEDTRSVTARKGRQFELDRFEAANASLVLSNNESSYNPENTASPYYPNVEPTHRLRWQAYWDGTTYDIFNGFLEGYPQQYQSLGADALVSQRAVDFTMALALSKLTPGSTTLSVGLPVILPDATVLTGTLDVASTGLPMPQAVPFGVTVEGEEIQVTEILSPGQYAITRAVDSPAHVAGVEVLTTAVSFGEELTGERIRNVLHRVGVIPNDYDVDDGQTLLAPSADLAGQSPIEHMTLCSEVEGGRLFISKAGKVTFHSRHRPLLTELTARATFGDAGGSELAYSEIEVTHEHEKIFNIIRITAQSGYVAEQRDEDSIDAHMERVLEKQWPLANDNDADAAARYLISRYAEMQLRVPSIVLHGRSDPDDMWPHLLGMEIGQRFRVIRRISGTDIDKQLLVEGVEHSQSVNNLQTRAQMSLAETRAYWRVGITGYSELGTNTRVAY